MNMEYSFDKVIDLLFLARQDGVEIILNDDKLQLKVEENDDISEHLLNEIRNNKQDIIAYLSSDEWKTVKVDNVRNKISRFSRTATPHIPASFSQERLWFIDSMGDSEAYHLPTILRLAGSLNTEALSLAMQSIIERHEALRTIFNEQEGQVYQSFKESSQWQLQLVEGTAYAANPDALKAHVEKLVAAPFDLAHEFPVRASLIRLQDQVHILVVTIHHIASDAWSVAVMVQELIELYNAFSQSSTPLLSPLPLQYADYSMWQRNYLQGEVLETKLAYWREKLQGTTALQLPTDYQRPVVQNTTGERLYFRIGKAESDQLQNLCCQQGVTLFMALLSVYKMLLYRYSGQSDICVGTSLASRRQRELEGLIGFFVNTLALRDEVDPAAPFTQLLQQVKATTLEAYEHQDLPFEKVVEAVVKERDSSRSPLFQVMLVLANTPPAATLRLGEVVLTQEPYDQEIAKFDITFFINEESDGLSGSIQFTASLYTAATIQRMAEHFVALINSAIKNPAQLVGLLPMLSSMEENQLLHDFNNSQVAYPIDKSIVDLFEEQVTNVPHQTALVFEDTLLTYQQLNERSNQLAHYLKGKGVQQGDLVPLYMERSADMMIGLLGILKAGAAYVPVDTGLPADRLRYLLQDTAAKAIVCDAGSSTRLAAETDLQLIEIEDTTLQPTTNLSVKPSAEDTAYVIYTSGSTGTPKGILVSHRNLADYYYGLDQQIQISQSKSFALVSTIATDLGNTVLFGSLLSGGALHLFTKESVSNIEYLHDYFSINPIDCLKIVPSHWQALCTEDELLLPRQLLIFGGEALPGEVVATIQQAGTGCRIVNHYGPTETTIGKLLYPIESGRQYGNTVPIGKPFSNTQVYILSKELQPCPIGVPGQLYIAGDGLAKGYLNNEVLTQKKFISNPFTTVPQVPTVPNSNHAIKPASMYATGDRVKWNADGTIQFIGRVDDQVKIRGYRVEPGEVTSVLLQHEDIRTGVVLANPDKQGNNRLVAYVVPQYPYSFERESLLAYLKEQLPEYMVPSVLIAIEEMPLTPNGKINRRALPDADAMEQGGSGSYVAPRNETEEKLAAIWADVLEVEQVGVEDDFFVLGGHSLLAIRLVSLIRKAFEVEIPIGDIFDYPTVALLATRLGKQTDAPLLPAITAVSPRPERIPLSFSQERLWFIDQLDGSVQYHVPSVVRLQGQVNTAALSNALKQIVLRHEVLRTVIGEEEGQPYQVVKELGDWHLQEVDGSLYQDDRQTLQQYLHHYLSQPFDLSTDYPLRAVLLRLQETEYVLAVVLHHIASDGYSTPVLVRELVELYNAAVEQRPALLPVLPVQYADYALWQRNYLQGDVLAEKLHYWKDNLAGVATLQLPTDYSRPLVQSTRGAITSFQIDKELSGQLQALSQQHGVTLFMTLLSAFNVLLYRYSGQQDICVGTPTAGREQAEVEGLIGFFVNTLALRSQVDGSQPFTQLLQQVKQMTLAAYEHQQVPFEKVVEAVVKERDMSRSPLFQVMLTLQNTPPVAAIKMADVIVSAEVAEHTVSMFDLTLGITETTEGLSGSLEYCTDVYERQTMLRMINHYVELLQSIVKKPEQKIESLTMLTAAERHQLLVTFNNTQVNYPTDKTIIALFEEQVSKTPDKIAVVFEQESLTYKELNKRANQLAHYLRSKGVAEETLVPLCINRSIELVTGILGILKAGGAYIAIDTEYPEDRIKYMLEDTGAGIVLSSPESRLKLQNAGNFDLIELNTDWEIISKQNEDNLQTAVKLHHLAYIIYTSGSTGRPKGVMIEHASLLGHVQQFVDYFSISSEDNVIQQSSPSFDILVEEIYPSLTTGACIYFIKDGGKDIPNLKKYIENNTATIISSTPLVIEYLNKELSGTGKLRYVITGGEVLYPSNINNLFGKVPIVNGYGPSETTVSATYNKIETIATASLIGKPINNASIYILGAYGELLPVGITGEICIGGLGVARGYLNQQALTEEKFVANPFAEQPGARMYKTGDVGRWLADGNIEYLGRRDEQVKIRGYRIELGEIESALQNSPMIREAVVLAKTNESGTKRLIAYVVPGKNYSNEAITTYLGSQLPEYMVPQAWVEIEALPVTPNGKIDKKALPEVADQQLATSQYIAPRTEAEQALSGIWQSLLGVEKAGIHDNFFELGGDSILTIQVVSRMRRLGYELHPRDLFRHQTIAKLSAAITERSAAAITGEQGILTGSSGLLPIQQWYLQSEPAASSHFNQALLFSINKSVTAAVVQQAVAALMQQHDALRFRYTWDAEGQWQQEYGSSQGIVITEEVPSAIEQSALKNWIEATANYHQQQLDIEKGELVRVIWMQTPATETHNRLLVIVHHLAVDGVSWRILLEDLEGLFTNLSRGQKPELGTKSSSYRQWYQALQHYGQRKEVILQLPYWQNTLQSYQPLPVDKIYADKVTEAGLLSHSIRLNAEQTSQLLQQAPQAYQTEINDLLLCALALTLNEWAKTSHVVIGLEGHGREAIGEQQEAAGLDTSRTVGWFTTLYPVLLATTTSGDAGDQLKSIKEQLRRLLGKGLGYGVLKYINREAALQTEHSAWDVLFNYLGQLDNTLHQSQWLTGPAESAGASISPINEVSEKLSVNASVQGGELVLNWAYSSLHYEKDTITRIAGSYIARLEELIRHCVQQLPYEGPVHTPSDYSLGAEISYQELDQFLQQPYKGRKRKEQIESMYRLSGLQQGMLFHGLYDQRAGAYTEQFACNLFGVNVDYLLTSWQHVMNNHSALRSGFYYDAFSVPVQCVYKEVSLPLEVIDYRNLSPEAQAVAIKEYEAADRSKGFDFTDAPLMRVGLLRLSEERYRMVWTSHHILFDGWSLPILMEEFLHTYEALTTGAALIAKEDKYEDYIRFIESRDQEQEEAYWRQYLHGIEQSTLLPFIRSGAESSNERTKGAGSYHTLTQVLDSKATQQIHHFARQHRLTVSTVMQGVWSLLLHHYTSSPHVAFGIIVSGRPEALPEVEQRVGMYINTLPLHSTLPQPQEVQGQQAGQETSEQAGQGKQETRQQGKQETRQQGKQETSQQGKQETSEQAGQEQTVAAWLQQLQQRQVASQPYQYTPLAAIQGWSGIQGDLFDSILVFENYPVSKVIGARQWSLAIEEVQMQEQTNYPLTILISSAEETQLRFSYNTTLLQAAQVAQIQEHFIHVLEQIAAGSENQAVNEIALLTESEQQLLHRFNDTQVAYPKDKTLVDLLEEQAGKTPDSIAVVFEGGQLTYRELNQRSNQFAHYLREKGVKEETLVPICIERNVEMMVGIIGILKAGGAYVPIDPQYPEDRIRYMLEDTAASMIVSNKESSRKVAVNAEIEAIEIDSQWDKISQQPSTPVATHLTPDNLAYVIYTSGSTGRPKGVMNQHSGIVNRLLWAQGYYQLSKQDTVLQKTTFSFDVSVWELLWPLLVGSRLVFAKPEGQKDPAYLAHIIETQQVTMVHFVPSMLSVFLQQVERGRCSGLRHVLCSGEALSPALATLCVEKLPAAALHNLYGPTEAAIDVTYWSLPKEARNKAIHTVPIGKPIANTQIYITDKQGKLTPLGVAGEICIAGIGVARGYLNQPRLTEEKFIHNPFTQEHHPGTKLYRTGDMGRWLADGNIEYLGRGDEQVKIRGYRIELGEIETVIQQHISVKQAVVIVRDNGEGSKQLVGYIVAAEGFSKEAITAYLVERLPDYMVPQLWVTLDSLPLTASGKTDRKALPQADAGELLHNQYEAPRTELEQALADIWQRLLGVEKAGIHDNFFELGGDSILTIQVVSRMRRLGYELHPKDLFIHQTIAKLSAAITERSAAAATGEQGILTGSSGLLPIQQWYLQKEVAAVSHFNQAILLSVNKSVTEAMLQQAVAALIQQHDALRFRYTRNAEGQWQQAYSHFQATVLLENIASAAHQNSVSSWVEERAGYHQQQLDIEKGELVRVVWMQTPATETHNRLLVIIHHLAIDGVSWRILLEDLELLLNALSQGQKPELGTKGSSYRQWYQALQHYGQRKTVLSQLPHWQNTLQSYQPLPVDKVYAGKVTAAGMAYHNVTLSVTQTQQLLQQVPKAYHTEINDLLLAALAYTISQWSGKDKVVIGMEGHGREAIGEQEEINTSRTVGWFTSLYPVLLQTAETTDTGNQLQSIKEQLRRTPDRGIGFGVLKYINQEAALQDYGSSWDILFNYLGQFDNIIKESNWFQGAAESAGASGNPDNEISEKLSVSGSVQGGELVINWAYSHLHYEAKTITRLADNYITKLSEFIDYCVRQLQSDGPVFTPSDYGLGAEVSYQELNEFLQQPYKGTKRKDQLEGMYRLSSLQQGMLFHSLYDGQADTYTEQFSCDLTGANPDHLISSWQQVMNNHSALRSSFYYDVFSIPVQCVYKQVSLPVTLRDYRSLSLEKQAAAITEYENQSRKQGFDFTDAPLIRIGLLRLSEERYRMVWTSHHILFDGWSLPILMEEFLHTYESLSAGAAVQPLPEDKYEDYIRYIESRDKDQEEAYWRQYLAPVTQSTLLPFITATTERNKGEGNYRSITLLLDEQATQKIQSFAQQQRLTVSTLMQGVWSLLLHRYTGNRDVAFGTIVSGRPDDLQGVERRVGMYINTLPVRSQLQQNQKVGEWLQELQGRQVTSLPHQHTSLSDIQGWSNAGGDLFDSILIFENYPVSEVIASGQWSLSIDSVQMQEQTNYPLSIIAASAEKTNIYFSYNADLLKEVYVEKIKDHFAQALQQLTEAGSEALVGELELLTPAEKHELLVTFNDTTVAYPTDKSMVDLFEEQAAETPEQVAVMFEDTKLTYGQLNVQSNQLAHYLKSKGVGAETLVAVCIERSAEMVIAILGILKAGGAYVPIDPQYPEERIQYMLQDTGANIVVSSQNSRVSLLATGSEEHSSREIIEIDGFSRREIFSQQPKHNLQLTISPRQLAYVIYTSGSTGTPKGVMIEHGSVHTFISWCRQEFAHSRFEMVYATTSICFDLSVFEIFYPLSTGKPLRIIENGLQVTQHLPQDQYVLVNTVPSVVQHLLSQPNGLYNISVLNMAGEPISAEVQQQLDTEKMEVRNLYGPTEDTTYSTVFRLRKGELVTIGKPIANTQIHILDDEGRLVPAGVTGEICIAGAGLARGYLNRTDLTAEKFIPNPYSHQDGERLYRTGDVGRWLPDGNIEYLGRRDEQVKIRGYRIELGEIEAVLQQSGLVKQSVVVARPDKQGNKQLAAYVVASDVFDKEAAIAYLASKLPAYMVPQLWMQLDAFPLTANGKTDKKALPDIASDTSVTVKYEAPRTELEIQLADTWQNLLGIPQIGIHDNFFELGGDSILTIQVVSRMRRLGYELKPKDIFLHQTISRLSAAVMEHSQWVTTGEQGVLTGHSGLLPIQQWYLQKDRAAVSHFNQALLLSISKTVTQPMLQQAIRQLMQQHDALRFTYAKLPGNGEWQQTYGNIESLIHTEDLQATSSNTLSDLIKEKADGHQRKLDIEKGELVRAVWMQTPAAESHNRLLIIIHHLAVDGVSWRILLEDLEALLTAISKGQQPKPDLKTSSYRQWYNILEQYGKSSTLLSQTAYWQNAIQNYQPLPVDKNGTLKALEAQTGSHRITLNAALTRQLLQDVPRVYHTEINDILLCALAVTLCQWDGRKKVVIGLEGHGREAIGEGIDTSRTVGWFTTLYPVLLKTASANGAGQQIKSVKEQLRRVPGRGLGYGILKYMNKEATLQTGTVWDIIFNYLGQLDNVVKESKWLKGAEESVGALVDESYETDEKLSVNSFVQGGELQLAWSYSQLHYEEATITRLASAYVSKLQELIEHCLQQTEPVFTPSDYGLGAEISYAELDRFLEETFDGKKRRERIESVYRLSGLQQGMLFHSLYDEEVEAYTQQFTGNLTNVDIGHLTESWQQVFKNHSILRSSFHYDVFSIPVQCVYRGVSLPVQVLDYRGMNSGEQAAAITAFETADRSKGFDFATAPLMRITLIQTSSKQYRMVWTFHHILFDGWSLPVLIEEFLTTYESLANGRPVKAQQEDKYEDYIRYIESRDQEQEEAYWRQYLHGIEQSTLLPFIRSGAESSNERTKGAGSYHTLTQVLDSKATQQIHHFAQQHRLTVSTVMQGVWALLLHHYTGSPHVAFGIIVSGRPEALPEVEQRVGMYINTLPLHSTLPQPQEVQGQQAGQETSEQAGQGKQETRQQGKQETSQQASQASQKSQASQPQQETSEQAGQEQTVAAWLQQLQQQQVASQPYQYTPLAAIQGWSGIQGDLFDSILVFENYPVSKVIGARQWSLAIEDVQMQEQTNYPLTLLISSAEETQLRFSYNTTLLSAAQVAQIQEHFIHVLEQIATGSKVLVGDLDLLTPPERHQLLEVFNATEAAYSKDKTIVDLFEEQVEKTPQVVAVVFEEEKLTYKELHERSNQLAHYLREKGVRNETLVPICVERSLEMMVGILGILKAGGAYVPVDPEYPEERIKYMLEDTSASIVVSSRESRAKLTTEADVIEIDGHWNVIDKQSTANLSIDIEPYQLAYIIYTSGSTGRPKGVMIEHGNVYGFIWWCHQEFAANRFNIAYATTSICFDLSVFEIFYPLSIGKPLRIVENGLHIGDYLDKDNSVLINTVPSVIQHLLQQHTDLSNISILNMAGEPIPAFVQQGLDVERIEVRNLYGPTEDTTYSTVFRLQKDKPVNIGVPISNTSIYILSPQYQLLPVGVVGEICIGGAGVARGYLHQEQLTKEKFIPNPYQKGSRLYKTGDVGRWLADGNIEYLGRKDDQIKIRGYRIELGEIENTLQNSPMIREAVVIATASEAGTKWLVAYVVPGEAFSKEAITGYLGSQLPDYMVPQVWVELDNLPLTPNGKVDRKALPQVDATEMFSNKYVAPRTELEQALAGIWQSLLGMEQVGIHDNFFELGGDSLLVMRLIAAIKIELKIDLSVATLFELRTIDDLATYIKLNQSSYQSNFEDYETITL